MRVLFWAELYWPYVGGIEVHGRTFLRALRERGHDVQVVTSHGSLTLPDEEVHEDVPIHRFQFLKALAERRLDWFAQIRARLSRLKHDYQPDIVHLSFTDPSALFHLQTQPARPVPTVTSIRVALPNGKPGAETLTGRTLRSAAWVTTNSKAMLEDVRRLEPAVNGRSSVIYEGLETPNLSPAPLGFDTPRLLCLGRVVRDKGFDIAIDAMPAIQRAAPGARLLIAGDGPARPELEQQAGHLGLSDAIEFLGWVPPEKVPELINSTTIVLMPSRWREAFGLVALQAMQMARPVVAADVGGLPELVSQHETGLLVPKEDAAALATSVIRLLHKPELAEALGAAGRRRALSQFDVHRHVDEYETLFQTLIQEEKRQ